MNMKNNRSVSILLIAAIVILINILGNRYFVRLDLTKDKQYTLSNATKNILKDLEDPITVTAYFSDELPPDIQKTKQDFREMLTEYATRSKQMVNYEFINPSEDPQLEQQLLQQGIQPVMINVREKDQMKQQKAYLAATINLGEQQEVIPFIQPGAGMEYSLTTNIKKLAASDKPYVGLIAGHGEPAVNELSQLYQSLAVLYNVETINLTTEPTIADRYATIIWIRPTDTIPPTSFDKVDGFLRRGGNLLIAFNKVDGDFSTSQGKSVNIGMSLWLRNKNIEVEDAFVIDASCGQVTVQQRQGAFTFNTPVQFPYLPLVNQFKGHPITEGLEQVILQFVSPVRFLGDSTKVFTSFLESSEKAGIARNPVFFDVQRQWTENDFPMSNISVAGLVEGTFGGSSPSKLIVFGDGDFPISGQRGTSPDNISLLSNAVDFLSDDTGLVELRTKGAVTRPIKDLEDGKRNFYKYLNFLAPILLIIIYGFIRSQQKRNLRLKRREQSYV